MRETVDRAVVIGAVTKPYEFWTRDGRRRIGKRRLFESDAEAEEWIKSHFPTDYAQGLEMRRFE